MDSDFAFCGLQVGTKKGHHSCFSFLEVPQKIVTRTWTEPVSGGSLNSGGEALLRADAGSQRRFAFRGAAAVDGCEIQFAALRKGKPLLPFDEEYVSLLVLIGVYHYVTYVLPRGRMQMEVSRGGIANRYPQFCPNLPAASCFSMSQLPRLRGILQLC